MDSKLSAMIVHDIKNALAILEGELRQLTDAPDRTRAGHAHTICLNLQDKLVGFLTLYKASSQGLVAQIDAVSPIDFLTMLIDQLSIGKSGIALSLSATPMPVVAFFDEHLVTLALEAALRNAMRFALSRIEIGCVQRDGFLVFSIQDDGPGVGAKEKIASTGLGMHLCKVIAEAHIKDENSGIAVLRNSAGGGALFELCLP
ncbi:MAG TPA: HAMP domain-containing sensor histidine kinase [Herbaspirillum sp.]|jgi:signal transduction histidine kinase|nr:HAMP domain-containing sensor histidine kinase [Herbaspirillum sp.]